MLVTARGGWAVRISGGVAAFICGVVILVSGKPEQPLGVATLLLGLFVLLHAWADSYFQSIRLAPANPAQTVKAEAPIPPPPLPATPAAPDDPSGGLKDFASSFVATSGVILGLLAVFGDHKFSLTTKVGIVALITDILIGSVLVGLVLTGSETEKGWNAIRLLFNLALWALALGLLSIGLALLYA